MSWRGILLRLLVAAGVGLFLGNTSLFEDLPGDRQTRLIAHRGLHHVYAGAVRTADTCRAQQVEPITHSFIENTIPSMRAAFDAGADVVEIDVHRTPDNRFAVFHDWRLECQTNGTGVTHETDFETLTTLDLGYNISADSQTFPLRGQGVGLMPSLEDVVRAELPGQVLVNFKSNDAKDGAELAKRLNDPAYRAAIFGVYGGTEPTQYLTATRPEMLGLHRPGLKRCLTLYALLGWSGYVPTACRNGLVGVPANVAPYLWGWPHRFTRRMKGANSAVILWGAYDGTGFSSGIDTVEATQDVPEHFDGYVWTNKIEIIAPALRNQRNP